MDVTTKKINAAAAATKPNLFVHLNVSFSFNCFGSKLIDGFKSRAEPIAPAKRLKDGYQFLNHLGCLPIQDFEMD